MSTTYPEGRTKRRPSSAARRFGYFIAVLINAGLLYLVNVWPGWEEVSFLTEDTTQVLSLVNLQFATGIVVNVIFMLADPPFVKALGELITNVVGFVATVRVWQVFPFDFTGWDFDWTIPIRVVLAIGIAGTALGALVNLVKLIRAASGASR